MHDVRPTRVHRDRDIAPQPTDIAERMVAAQRKKHSAARPKDRAERAGVAVAGAAASRSPPSPRKPTPSAAPPPPQVVVVEPSADEFSRRLTISGSPRATKLYNPETDVIPMRRTTEPEAMSDSAGSSHAVAKPKPQSSRQLFDHRRDDPVRFSVQARKPTPTPKSSGDYSSTSSYAPSTSSSNFTLTSDSTTDSSSPSSLFDRKPRDESKTNAFSAQLKKLYRDISALEAKILQDSGEVTPDDSRVLLKGGSGNEDPESLRWKKAVEDHKALAEMMHNLLAISLAPNVPASLRNIPEKYNIVIRLWTHAFHRLLENLRRSSLNSKIAMEHLQDFIYYAYTFYTGLLEEETLVSLKPGWLEALGDLARYRMAIASMVPSSAGPSSSLTAAAVSSSAQRLTPTSTAANASAAMSTTSSRNPAVVARIDDSPSPSVGIAAARMMELEPEKERWRTIAKQWYAEGVANMPGTGKLHHHLGLLSREVEGEELRAVYHFVKSMIAIRPFETSRESVLSIWSPAAQARRSAPDARTADLFVLLHGMLFTNIQLDDFAPTLARFMERLSTDAPEAREWTMMAAINIGAMLEYGRSTGVLRRAGVVGAGAPVAPAKKLAKKVIVEEKMDVDEAEPRRSNDGQRTATHASPALSDAQMSTDPPPAFTMAQQIAFTMLAHALEHLDIFEDQKVPGSYVTVMLTFLPTVMKSPQGLAAVERLVPWESLTRLLIRVPRRALKDVDTGEKLTAHNALPEDWAVRGMAWPGRGLYERGFWASGESRQNEMEMLDERDETEADGQIGDDSDETKEKESRETLRWRRVAWAGRRFTMIVDGFRWDEERRWWTEGALAEKVRVWAQLERAEREEEERRKLGTRWDDSEDFDMMDVDDDIDLNGDSSGQSDDDEDTEEVRALKARRRYLQSLLQTSQRGTPSPRRPRPRGPRKTAPPTRPALNLRPGYTILVLDTNILLSSLAEVATLVESRRWTVVIPLPVIMELDGLGNNTTVLGDAAKAAITYLTAHFKQYSSSLKVLTSRGNYLSSLNVRSEQVDFDDPDAWERNMDDLILKAAIWQDEHWQDRSMYLTSSDPVTSGDGEPAKVVLLSLDRNLRLKARSRQLLVASERDLGGLLSGAS